MILQEDSLLSGIILMTEMACLKGFISKEDALLILSERGGSSTVGDEKDFDEAFLKFQEKLLEIKKNVFFAESLETLPTGDFAFAFVILPKGGTFFSVRRQVRLTLKKLQGEKKRTLVFVHDFPCSYLRRRFPLFQNFQGQEN